MNGMREMENKWCQLNGEPSSPNCIIKIFCIKINVIFHYSLCKSSQKMNCTGVVLCKRITTRGQRNPVKCIIGIPRGCKQIANPLDAADNCMILCIHLLSLFKSLIFPLQLGITLLFIQSFMVPEQNTASPSSLSLVYCIQHRAFGGTFNMSLQAGKRDLQAAGW